MNSKEYKKVIVNKLGELLKPKQYKKRGNVFSFFNGDLTYYIGIQSSQSSTKDVLKVTINTQIASALLSKLDDRSLPIEVQRHYDRRIGFYFDVHQDKWWTITSIDSAKSAADEIAGIIVKLVIPNFDGIKTTYDLANIWRKGGYIGTSEAQRKKYLSLLDQHNN